LPCGTFAGDISKDSNLSIKEIIKNGRTKENSLGKIKYLRDTIQLKIIYRELPPYFCGFASTASLTQGIVKLKDTIVIISLCDMNKEIKNGNNISVFPCDSIGFSIDIVGNTNKYLNLIKQYKTYYGTINQK
jgi:hypothetical protein